LAIERFVRLCAAVVALVQTVSKLDFVHYQENSRRNMADLD
jgi:hypothetical protein